MIDDLRAIVLSDGSVGTAVDAAARFEAFRAGP
jgi:hypothetical protein